MIQISVSELKAKLTAPKQDKISAAMSLFDILPPEADLDKARMERLG